MKSKAFHYSERAAGLNMGTRQALDELANMRNRAAAQQRYLTDWTPAAFAHFDAAVKLRIERQLGRPFHTLSNTYQMSVNVGTQRVWQEALAQ